MNPKSLLIVLTDPPQVRVQSTLLEDYASSVIDNTPVFASVAPWNPMHDLLIDRETRTLAGIVYPVAARERAAMAAVCKSLPTQVVRYCISPISAADRLMNLQIDLNSFHEPGDRNAPIMQFPKSLRPHRQLLRGVLAGEIDREQFPAELRSVAATYFEDNAAAEHLSEWANGGGDVPRVEVTWVNKPVAANLPGYFPSDLGIELAQHFAEDIWFYRDDNKQAYAIGINHLDGTLDAYGLRLPAGLLTGAG